MKFGVRFFGQPLLSQDSPLVAAEAEPHAVRALISHRHRGNEVFQPLPRPVAKPPFRLTLESVIGPAKIAAIKKAGQLVFHTAGDSGGISNAAPQTIVAKKLAEQLNVTPASRPAFFYHLGDIVSFKGEAANYFAQFYEAYEYYQAPIFAIPGNHDGTPPGDGHHPLEAFMRNFCSPIPRITPDAGDVQRSAMTQPYCHFTLETPFVTIIGLYSNVPSGGRLHNDQLQWLIGELKAASRTKALLLAMHHPIFSADDHHSGDENFAAVIHGAFKMARRIPHAILSGHVHNYQRFTRKVGPRSIPYLVIGAGGYHNLHGMRKAADGEPLPVPSKVAGCPDVTLESYMASRHGFARITVSAEEVLFEYFTVPRPHESWSAPAARYDTCRLHWPSGRILPG
jgi:hypothetical protein